MDERAAEVADLDLEAAAMLEGILAGTVNDPGPYVPPPRRLPKPPPPVDPHDPEAPDAATPDELTDLDRLRPRTWGACVAAGWPRECPFLGCRYHLGLDLNRQGRGPPAIALHDLPSGAPCCALAVAAAGPHTFQEVAGFAGGRARERVRQIEIGALEALRAALAEAAATGGLDPEPEAVGWADPW